MTHEIYKQEHNDSISKIFYDAIAASWKDFVTEYGEGFRSVRTRHAPTSTAVFGMCSDGIGTKVEVAELMNYFNHLGHDLVAMVCDDASAMGAIPFMMTTTLDFGTMHEDIPYDKIKSLASGLVHGAHVANVPVVAGESGQMGSRISGYGKLPILWNAALTYWAEPKNIVTGDDMKVGDFIVGIPEPYCRSNGYTLIRKIAEEHSGSMWVNKPCPGTESNYGTMAIHPSKIYTRHIQHLLRARPLISGMIHVTGGGLRGRLKSYLNFYGLGATIDNAYPACPLFQGLIESGLVGIKTAYETWCMGNGFLIVTPDPGMVISILQEDNCESRIIGQITEDPTIRISSNLTLEW